MKIILFITILVYFVPHSFAAETKESLWFGTFAKKALTEKYSFWIETQVRYGIDTGSTNQVLYRTGLLQNLNDKHGLGYLYAHIQSPTSREHRLTLQHTMNHGSIDQSYKLSHRARLEGRFLEGVSQDNAGRFRYLLRADQIQFSSWGLIVWDEVFINLNKTKWNGDNSFERNRFFIGLKKLFLESNHLEVGYLNQTVPRKTEDTSEHILALYLFF